MNTMARRSIATIFMMIALFPISDAGASERNGFYFGADIGISIPNDLESTRTNRGIGTNCDQFLDPATLNDGTRVPLPLEQCTPRDRPAKANFFDLGPNMLAGVNIGYALHNFRFEAEYFRRQQTGENLPLVVPDDDKLIELYIRNEKMSEFRADNFFANVYYDFDRMLTPKLTPYLGVGVGIMRVQIDYSGESLRLPNREEMLKLGRNPNAAGLDTLADALLQDTLAGSQFLVGLDYALSEQFSLGLKFRYGDSFGDFNDRHPWTRLRSHASVVGPPGTPGANLPITYGIRARNFGFYGISLNLKYYFNL